MKLKFKESSKFAADFNFGAMPVIEKDQDGTLVVKCTEYVKKEPQIFGRGSDEQTIVLYRWIYWDIHT